MLTTLPKWVWIPVLVRVSSWLLGTHQPRDRVSVSPACNLQQSTDRSACSRTCVAERTRLCFAYDLMYVCRISQDIHTTVIYFAFCCDYVITSSGFMWYIYSEWWRHQMEIFSALLALYEGNPPMDCHQKRHWHGALMFSLICVWTNDWTNNRDACDMRRHCTHYGITVMMLYGVVSFSLT